MSRVNGQLVTCDRCGENVFRKWTGEKETDGGFTRWDTFKDLPEGWSVVRNMGDLCPDCSAEWNKLETEFMSKKVEFMRGDGEKCNT
jgi:hypothetical protein